MSEIKIRASKKYELVHNPLTRCFDLLEWGREPYMQGCRITSIPKEELIDLIAEHWGNK